MTMNSNECCIWLNSISSQSVNFFVRGSHSLLFGINFNIFNANPSMNQDMNPPYRLHHCIGRHTTGNRNTSLSNGPLIGRPVHPAANREIEEKINMNRMRRRTNTICITEKSGFSSVTVAGFSFLRLVRFLGLSSLSSTSSPVSEFELSDFDFSLSESYSSSGSHSSSSLESVRSAVFDGQNQSNAGVSIPLALSNCSQIFWHFLQNLQSTFREKFVKFGKMIALRTIALNQDL